MDIYVNSEETLLQNIKQIKSAQKKYSTYSQEQVDKIFKAVASVANENRIVFEECIGKFQLHNRWGWCMRYSVCFSCAFHGDFERVLLLL